MSLSPLTPGQRVVDVASGDIISHAIEADPVAGRVRRVAVANGILVRDGDQFLILDEDREIRIEAASDLVTVPPVVETGDEA